MGIEGEVKAPSALAVVEDSGVSAPVPVPAAYPVPVAEVPTTAQVPEPHVDYETEFEMSFSFGERLLIAQSLARNGFDDVAVDVGGDLLARIKFVMDDGRNVSPEIGEARLVGWQFNPQNGAIAFDSGVVAAKGERNYMFNLLHKELMVNIFRQVKMPPVPSLISIRKKLGIARTVADFVAEQNAKK